MSCTHSTLYHLPQHPQLRQASHVDEDIVGRVSAQRCMQSLLVEVVSDETDRAAEHEQRSSEMETKACKCASDCTVQMVECASVRRIEVPEWGSPSVLNSRSFDERS